MTGSLFFYAGVFVALLGGGTIVGSTTALAALHWPAREVIVHTPQTRLDAIMPRYLFHEQHRITINATLREVDRAIRTVTADEIPLYRTLTSIRRRGRSAPDGLMNASRGTPMLVLAQRSGFRVFADVPMREVVLHIARPAPPSGGHVRIAIDFRLVEDGNGRAVLSTETRVHATDEPTRRALARYWRVILPGSALIRRGWLHAIRVRAEGLTSAPQRR